MVTKLTRRQWNATCLAAGLTAISKRNAAIILAITYVYGGEREVFTHDEKLMADLEYIQIAYGFEGGNVPDEDVSEMYKQYVEELSKDTNSIPQWAVDYMQDNYQIKLTD